MRPPSFFQDSVRRNGLSAGGMRHSAVWLARAAEGNVAERAAVLRAARVARFNDRVGAPVEVFA